MKKILFLFLISLLVSCTTCTNKTLEVSELNVTNLIQSDKQIMNINHQDNFVWYETLILMENFLDEDNSGEIAEISNIFQSLGDTVNFDTTVFKFRHFSNGTSISDSISGFWIEDIPLVDSLITISYDSAFVLINKCNIPKPHSKNVVLRNPLGPFICNPQWVFGNIHSQIWVDALTGEIRESNPAFPEAFEMPLGEWP